MLVNSLVDALQNNDIVMWREVASANDNKGVERSRKQTECVQNVA